MRWLQAICVIAPLSACQADERPVDEANCLIPDDYERIIRRADDPYDHWHIRVDKTGALSWNGQTISVAELKTYSAWLARRPKEAGRLSLEIEHGAPCAKVEEVRSKIAASQLCKQGRCVEADWDVPTPIVN